MSRRQFLHLAAAGIGVALSRPVLASRTDPPGARRLQIRHAANGRRFSGIWHDGQAPDPVAMAELSEVLADTRSGRVRPFDADAIAIAWELAQKQRVNELMVLSGFRTPETNRAVNGAGDSQHLIAAALDVAVPAARYGAFSEAAIRLGKGGVGLYRNHGFVHLDSGPVRRWGSEAGGDNAVIAALPRLPRSLQGQVFMEQVGEAWAPHQTGGRQRVTIMPRTPEQQALQWLAEDWAKNRPR
jgi:uncharacterized protein YcbK (DUF882 family)